MEIKGKYGVAKVYASLIDGNTKVQIKELMDQKFIKDLDVRIMADCHAGKGCVIGTTMKVKDKIVPNLVGVDIGCGMLTVKLGKMDINLVKLDRFIRKKIPNDNDVYNEEQESDVDVTKLKCYEFIKNKSVQVNYENLFYSPAIRFRRSFEVRDIFIRYYYGIFNSVGKFSKTTAKYYSYCWMCATVV